MNEFKNLHIRSPIRFFRSMDYHFLRYIGTIQVPRGLCHSFHRSNTTDYALIFFVFSPIESQNRNQIGVVIVIHSTHALKRGIVIHTDKKVGKRNLVTREALSTNC